MKNSKFLSDLLKEGKIELVEPSEEISKAYLVKSDKCIKVAELAFNAGIYENSVSEAYYSVYNSVLSLFFKCGIKCENHSGAAILLRDLFLFNELYVVFSDFKKDRIDNQYYVSVMGSEPLDKKTCSEKINIAKDFNIKIKTYADNLKLQEIKEIRGRVEVLR